MAGLSISKAGLALVDRIAAPLAVCHARQLGHMSAADLRQLCALLRAARQPHERAGSSWR